MNDRTRHHYNDRRTELRTLNGHETPRGVYALLDAEAGQSHGLDEHDSHHDDDTVGPDTVRDGSSGETLFEVIV
jgi:hypothetical protein